MTPTTTEMPVAIVARVAGDAVKKLRKRTGKATLRALKDEGGHNYTIIKNMLNSVNVLHIGENAFKSCDNMRQWLHVHRQNTWGKTAADGLLLARINTAKVCDEALAAKKEQKGERRGWSA